MTLRRVQTQLKDYIIHLSVYRFKVYLYIFYNNANIKVLIVLTSQLFSWLILRLKLGYVVGSECMLWIYREPTVQIPANLNLECIWFVLLKIIIQYTWTFHVIGGFRQPPSFLGLKFLKHRQRVHRITLLIFWHFRGIPGVHLFRDPGYLCKRNGRGWLFQMSICKPS